MVEVEWSHRADAQLDQIIRYIESDSVVAGEEKVASCIIGKAAELKRFPKIGEVVPEFGNRSLHEIHVFSY